MSTIGTDEIVPASREAMHAVAREIARLRAALRHIADMCPATQELTLAHQMAEEAEHALEGKEI